MPVPDEYVGANKFHDQDLARMRGAGKRRRRRSDTGRPDTTGTAPGSGAIGSAAPGPAASGKRRSGLRAAWEDWILARLLGRGRSARP
jgi:hypothetical protein